MAFQIRNYHASDLPALYRICLLTGADGGDATGMLDEEILGHFFAAPYAVLEPALCFLLTHDGRPCGYILGTSDSRRFEIKAEESWFPQLRARYRPPDEEDTSRQASMVRAIYAGYRAPAFSDCYPAHLHIDILPEGQGRRLGRELVAKFIETLRVMGAAGLHLGVSRRNTRALAWYPKLGFEVIEETPSVVFYGMNL